MTTTTTLNITDEQITTVREKALESQDYRLVAICDLAVEGVFADKYGKLTEEDIEVIGDMTVVDALNTCVAAFNAPGGGA